MAVVEYKHHKYSGDHRGHIPGFITDPDHWHNPQNYSYIGWADDNANYYVPWSSLRVLSKEDFVQRCFAMHEVQPIVVLSDSEEGRHMMHHRQLANLDEVRIHAEQWYDAFVARNTVD